MHKLIAIYKTPEDEDAFLKHYRGIHIPLVDKIPGLVKAEFTKIGKTLVGEPGNFLLAEMFFETSETFLAALKSTETAAAAADATSFAGGIVTVITGEVVQL